MIELETSFYPKFSLQEFDNRCEKARALMDAAKMDALLVTSEANYRYLTGLVLQQWCSPTRPRYFVLPRKGEPVAVVPRGNRISMAATSWVSDVRYWPAPQPSDDGISLLTEVLSECPKKFGTVGAELGAETRLGMPVGDFLRLRQAVQPLLFVDGSAIFSEMRMIKSPAEIERIRYISKIVSDGFENLSDEIHAGESERTICRKLEINLMIRGAEKTPYLVGCSGAGGYNDFNLGPTDRILETGDLLFIDAASTYDGYWCDFNRNFAFGPPSDDARRSYDLLYRATEAGIEAVLPGRPVCAIWQAMADVLSTSGTAMGRMGHGIGLNLTEPPSISRTDQTLLEAGMVIAIEPSLTFTASGKGEKSEKIMVHEENLVVTDEGCTLLSRRASPEITIVG